MSERRLLTYEQAADHLQIGVSTLYALVSKGAVRVVRLGTGRGGRGITRFRREDLDDLIASRVTPRKRGERKPAKADRAKVAV